MSNEEAIKALRTYPTSLDAVPKSAVSETNFRKALPIAIEALEKQIPKKPLDFGDESYLCPYCKRNNFYKGEYLDKQNYCDFCGQRIDWSEEGDAE